MNRISSLTRLLFLTLFLLRQTLLFLTLFILLQTLLFLTIPFQNRCNILGRCQTRALRRWLVIRTLRRVIAQSTILARNHVLIWSS